MTITRPAVLMLAAAAGFVLGSTRAPAAALDLLVADGNAGQILRYDGATGAPLGVFGQDSGTLAGIAPGPDRNLYVSNLVSQSVEEFSGADGSFLKTFVPGGSGGVIFPHDLTFGPDQNLYVDSGESDSILRYDGKTGAFIDTFASGHGLFRPTGLVFHGGDLFVSNSKADQILEFNATTGAYVGVFASGHGVAGPAGLTFDQGGNLYISNFSADNVLEFDSAGNFVRIFASGHGLAGPADSKFGPDGNLYVSGSLSNSIIEFDGATGAFRRVFASGGSLQQLGHILFAPAPVPEPTSLALMAAGVAGLLDVGWARSRRRPATG